MKKKGVVNFKQFVPNSPGQQAFIDALRDTNVKTILVKGGRRGGKTTVGAAGVPYFIYCRNSRIKENMGWCVSPTYKQAEFAMAAFEKVCGSYKQGGFIIDFNKAEKLYRLLPHRAQDEPYKVQFHTATEPDRMRGGATDFIWCDEGAYFDESTYRIIRPTLWGSGGPMWITTTPNGLAGVGKFAYETFRLADTDPTIKVITIKSIDNPAIPRAEIERDSRTNSRLYNLQEYEAEFVSFEGQIYPMFNKEKHVVQPIYDMVTGQPIDPKGFEGEMIVGIDWGFNHPFVYLWILKKGNCYLVMDEYYQPGRTFASHIEDIKGHVLEPNVCRRWADRTGPQGMAELERLGLGTYPSNSDTKMGIQAIAAAFEQGRLFISANCVNLIRELQTYHFRVGSDEPYKKDDDAVDALRYAIYSEATQEYTPNQVNPWVAPDQYGKPEIKDPGKGAHALKYDDNGNLMEQGFLPYEDPWDDNYMGGVGPTRIPIRP